MPNVHPYIQFAAAGLVLGIGHAVPTLWWLGLFGIAWFLAIVFYIPLTKTQLIVGGILSWTIRYGCSLLFYFSTYPISWLSESISAFQVPIITFYWFTVSLFLGLAGGLTAILLSFVKARVSRPALQYIYGGAILVCGEYLAPLFFMFATYGPGSIFNTAFSFGNSGYLLSEHEILILTAKWGGLYILTILAVSMGVLLLSMLRSKQQSGRFVAVLALSTLVVSANYTPFIPESPQQGMTVALVNTYFISEFSRQDASQRLRRETLEEAVTEAMALHPDVIVLPEDARFFDQSLTPDQAAFMFEFTYGETDTVIIDSARTVLPSGQVVLRATIIDAEHDAAYQIDKQYLVPQGEFMPYFYQSVLRLFGFSEAVTDVTEQVVYQPGPLFDQSSFPNHIPSVLFCFSDVNPIAAKRLALERDVPFIAHTISHGWFHEPTQYWYTRDRQMLRIQALWSGVPILTAANQAEPTHHTPNGAYMHPSIIASGEHYSVALIEL